MVRATGQRVPRRWRTQDRQPPEALCRCRGHDHAGFRERKVHGAADLSRMDASNHPGAESSWWRDRRATRVLPRQIEPICLGVDAPPDGDPASLDRKRSILDRIGRHLVHRQGSGVLENASLERRPHLRTAGRAGRTSRGVPACFGSIRDVMQRSLHDASRLTAVEHSHADRDGNRRRQACRLPSYQQPGSGLRRRSSHARWGSLKQDYRGRPSTFPTMWN